MQIPTAPSSRLSNTTTTAPPAVKRPCQMQTNKTRATRDKCFHKLGLHIPLRPPRPRVSVRAVRGNRHLDSIHLVHGSPECPTYFLNVGIGQK